MADATYPGLPLVYSDYFRQKLPNQDAPIAYLVRNRLRLLPVSQKSVNYRLSTGSHPNLPIVQRRHANTRHVLSSVTTSPSYWRISQLLHNHRDGPYP